MKSFRFAIMAFIFLQLSVSPLLSQQVGPMELVLLGTGYPYPSAERAGPSCAVIVGGKTFILDAGRGTVMRLAGLDVAWDTIAAAFITHLHSDHIDGLPDLFHSSWQFGSGRPFELYGPEGIQNVADGILKFYEADIHIRRDLTEKLSPQGASIKVQEVRDGAVYVFPEDVQITAFAVNHDPVKPAFGYRIDSGPYSIVFSGDTGPDPNLTRYAKDAGILVHEAYVRPDTGSGRGAYAWTIYDYHTSAREAGEAAAKANAGILVLTHLIPGSAPESLFLAEAKKSFDGLIIVGKDLMRIPVPMKRESSQ